MALLPHQPEWLDQLFACIDNRDADAFCGFLLEEATFRFGNADAVHGRAAIRDYVAGFFASIAAVEHRIEERWTVDGAVICSGRVTYTRLDGSTLSAPFANILKLGAADTQAAVRDYLIFVDASALYATT